MQWLKQLLEKLFPSKSKQKVAWDALDYGKPSTAGDEARDRNSQV